MAFSDIAQAGISSCHVPCAMTCAETGAAKPAHLLSGVVAHHTDFQTDTRCRRRQMDLAALHELQLLRVKAQEAKVVHLHDEECACCRPFQSGRWPSTLQAFF